jgi:hypothetical protein
VLGGGGGGGEGGEGGGGGGGGGGKKGKRRRESRGKTEEEEVEEEEKEREEEEEKRGGGRKDKRRRRRKEKGRGERRKEEEKETAPSTQHNAIPASPARYPAPAVSLPFPPQKPHFPPNRIKDTHRVAPPLGRASPRPRSSRPPCPRPRAWTRGKRRGKVGGGGNGNLKIEILKTPKAASSRREWGGWVPVSLSGASRGTRSSCDETFPFHVVISYKASVMYTTSQDAVGEHSRYFGRNHATLPPSFPSGWLP